ncbi:MAG: STAS/SEC14 domain-containing protein [Bacteroidales bacterium]|nr:STAS/SEC14 domain-containing protein [Bacteroidales bacterium]
MAEQSIEIRRISENEVRINKNILFIEGNILHLINEGEIDEGVAIAIVEMSGELSKNTAGKVNVLVDLNKGGKITPKARKMMAAVSSEEKAGKTALFGMNPVARVLALFFLGITNNKAIRFFKSKEEALHWLKE